MMPSFWKYFIAPISALLFLLPSIASAATLGISPASGATNVGGTLTATVFVSSADQAMNATLGTIIFPADLLQVVSISKANSVLSLWVQDPTFSNAEGTITWSGVVPNPGFTGAYGKLFSIQFRGKQAGVANVIFRSSLSEVLANDGNGTDILKQTSAGVITVSAASIPTPANPPTENPKLLAHITSSTHPDQTQWYNISHAVFDWTNAQGVTAVRLGYDSTPDIIPGVLYPDPISHKELDLEDGVWYFSVQQRDAAGWGPISTYKVQTDTTPPLPFKTLFLNGTTTTRFGSTIPIQFTTRDELSGIDHYEVAIDGKASIISGEEGSKPYAILGEVGTHTLIVRAYDKAGNAATAPAESFSILPAEKPDNSLFSIGWLAVNYLTLILVAIAIIITLIFGAWYIRAHFSAYRRRLNRQLGITEVHIHKKFDDLKDAITNELLKLEQVKSARQLTREEEKLISRFKKLLEQSEIDIEKELQQIPR